MSKKFKMGRCVHCLKMHLKLTSDHVLPQSWYPNGISLNFEKWQIPACEKCNHKYHQIEDEILLKVGICLKEDIPSAKGIREKAFRSINPSCGKNTRDVYHRAARKFKIEKQMIIGKNIPIESTIPGFGQDPNIKKELQYALAIDESTLKLFTQKVVRGIIYVNDKMFVEPDYNIDMYIVEPNETTEYDQLLNNSVLQYNCGDALKISRLVQDNNIICGIFRIIIWDKIKIWSSITQNVN